MKVTVISVTVISQIMNAFACDRWNCVCGKVNQGYDKDLCESCKGPKERGESLIVMPGDWQCSSCGYSNFASRKSCRQCMAPKTVTKPTTSVVKESSVGKEDPHVICPDTQQDDRTSDTLIDCASVQDVLVKDSLTFDDMSEIRNVTEGSRKRRRNSSLSKNIDGCALATRVLDVLEREAKSLERQAKALEALKEGVNAIAAALAEQK